MLNKVHLIGRVTKDPQQGGNEENPVTTFNLAVPRSYTNSQGQRDADFPFIKAFKNKNLAQNCAKYLKKGSLAYVEAVLRTSSRQVDGRTEYLTEFIAQDVQFLGDSQNNQNANNRSKNNQNNFNNNQSSNNQGNPFGDADQYHGANPFDNDSGNNSDPWPY